MCDGVIGFTDAYVLSVSFTMVAFLSMLSIDLCIVLLFHHTQLMK